MSVGAVDLTSREFEILRAMATRPGRVFTREDLVESAFEEDFSGNTRVVDAHVKNLRAKIEADPSDPRIIRTVFGVGYRLGNGGRAPKDGVREAARAAPPRWC